LFLDLDVRGSHSDAHSGNSRTLYGMIQGGFLMAPMGVCTPRQYHGLIAGVSITMPRALSIK
jgi:hypothetical protein